MALTIFNGVVLNRSSRQRVAARIAVAQPASETRAHFRGDPRRAPPDAWYLDQLARRLADGAGLPLPVAQKRVRQIAISARLQRSADGFQDRSR